MRVSRPFLTKTGRVRIGWRLGGFFGVTLLAGVAVEGFVPSGVLGGSFAVLFGALVAGWTLLALDGRRPSALGFYLARDSVTETLRGTALGVLIGMMVVGGMALLGGLTWNTQPGSGMGWCVGAVVALMWFAIPAAAEEALLRGYPLQALTESYGPTVGVIATSVAFGALHLGNPGSGVLEVANVTAAGLLFGVVYVKTLSLWLVTGLHLGWNWAHGYLADVPVSGLDVVDAPLYEGSTRGAQWLGGGEFGPEGSLVATAVLLAVTAWWWRSEGLKPGVAASKSGALVSHETNGNEQRN
ncbi:MAG: lysostaphin resistance A-like protein [Longimicrobiales bacterium]